MYEFFEHTADLGIRIRSESLTGLYSEAGMALTQVILENPESIRCQQLHTVVICQPGLDLLLFDWLNELLYLFETKRLIFSRFNISITGDTLQAEIEGEPWDELRHHLDHEVKAITYHELCVRQQPDGNWLAEVIVDI